MKKNMRKKGIGFVVILTLFLFIFFLISFSMTKTIGDVPKNSHFGDSLKPIAEISSLSVAHSTYINSLSEKLVDSFLDFYLISYVSKCNENNEYFLLDQSKNSSCFYDVSLDSLEFSNSFLVSIENEFLGFQQLLNSEKVEVIFNANLIDNIIEIKSDYKKSFSNSDINFNQIEEIQIDLSNELILINELKSNIEVLSKNLQIELPKCTINNKEKIICVKEISENYLSKNLENYEFRLEFISEENFFVLKVDVYDTLGIKKKLSFLMRFEDSVPFYHVDFKVEPYLLQNDIIKLSIDKPREPGKNLHGFIVLYSYENFFDSSTPGYQNLISLLSEKQKIPNDFENLINPYSTNKKIELRSSGKSLGFDVTTAFIPAKDSSSEETTLLLHQIYDSATQQYTKLTSGNELFVYVFAIDTSYSYYIDKDHFSSGIQSSSIEKSLPPLPLFTSGVSIEEINELEKGVAFSINGYDDSEYSSYAMYLCPTRTSFVFNMPLTQCEKIISPLLSQKSGSYIVYDTNQDSSFLDSYSSFNRFPLEQNLVKGDYFLYILPQNLDGEFIGVGKNLQYGLQEKNIDTLNFYNFQKYAPGSLSSVLEPFFIRFEQH